MYMDSIKKIKAKSVKAAADAITFAKENKVFMVRLGLMAAVAAVPDVGFCNSASNIQVTPLQKPVQMFTDLMTGPIPACFTVISGAVGGLSWGMGMGQQVTPRAIKCVGGGAVATSVGAGMEWIGIDGVSSCLFM